MLPVLIQTVKQLVPQVILEHLRDLLDVLLRYRTGWLETLKVVEQVGVLKQQLLEVDLGLLDDVTLVVVVDQLTVVLGQGLEALAAHEQDSHLG